MNFIMDSVWISEAYPFSKTEVSDYLLGCAFSREETRKWERKSVPTDGRHPGWFLRPVELARFFGKVDEKKAAAEATQENRKRAQSDGGS